MDKFSNKLQKLLTGDRPVTLQVIVDNFSEKSFGILFLLLLTIPSLPLPTGGITHIFEIVAILLALELISGRKAVWLPKKWLNKTLPNSLQTSALPKFIKIIRWIEKYSHLRSVSIQNNSLLPRLVGLVVLVFTIFAFLAPPFSGLDTLPSLGVVLLSLSFIFDDLFLSFIGIIVGVIGIGLLLLLGKLAFALL
ncbi:MAG TPA: exopolysaccharide biosynthesis protein [Candidatus Saccharimonadales bacterium]